MGCEQPGPGATLLGWPKSIYYSLRLRRIIVRYSTVLKSARVAKTIWRIIKKIASIWGENMLGYLYMSLDIIYSSHLTVFFELSENCSLPGTDNVRGQISEHIFAPNGDYCLYRNLEPIIQLFNRNTVTVETLACRKNYARRNRFSFSQTSSRVSITRQRLGPCFLFLK